MINTNLTCDISKAVKVQYLDGNLFSQDVQANTINVAVMDNGEPATISGTVSANIIRADGGTVAATGGTISGNVASITLPAAAYAIPGIVSIIVKLTASGVTTSIAAVVANVYESSTATAVDPGTIIPSIQTLIAAIDTAVASIPADYSSLWTSLAPAFSSSTSYVAGQYVTYNGGLYKFTNSHSGSWSSGDVTAVNLGNEISSLKSALNECEDQLFTLSDTKNVDTTISGSDVSSTASWVWMTNNLTEGKTYRIRMKLNGWSATQISKIQKVGLYTSNTGTALVAELDFGTYVADTWLTVYYTVPASTTIKVIKMSVAGSYSASTNTLSYEIIERIAAIQKNKQETDEEISDINNDILDIETDVSGIHAELMNYTPNTVYGNIMNVIDNIQPADTDQYSGIAGQTIISVSAARYINLTNGKWTVASGIETELIRIPADAKRVKITSNATNGTGISFLTSNVIVANEVAPFATGWTNAVLVSANTAKVFDIPSNAKFMYLSNKGTGTTSYKPQALAFQYRDEKDPSVKYDLEEKTLLLTAYDSTTFAYSTTRYIQFTNANNRATTWNTASSPSKSVLIPLDGAKKISITANDTNGAVYTFVKNRSTEIGSPSYADGYAHHMNLSAGASITLDVPGNAKFLYLRLVEADSTDRTPSSVKAYVEKNRVTKKRPLFCFVDDDAKQAALDWLEQVVDATRIPINIALITGGVGLDTFSTWDNIRRLRNKGFVFVNHTHTFVNLTTLTEEQVHDTFENSQRLMEEHGLPDSDILVFPGGGTNATVTAIVKDYFTAAASTQTGLNLPPINTFFFRRIDIDTYSGDQQAYVDQLDTWKAWVDKAMSANALCIFYGHAYHADYTADKLADYIALVQYIAQKGGEIVSLPEALRQYGNDIEGTVTVGCDEII